jgi:hypothetical protein
MSNRTSCDSIIRESIGQHMRWQHSRRWDNTPRAVLAEGIRMAAEQTARHLFNGETGLAYASARVHAALRASVARMDARHDKAGR